ncbi:MAG: YdcF family protein [Pseudomonadota bacterium]
MSKILNPAHPQGQAFAENLALDKVSALNSRLGRALQNYTTARTAIRDYVIHVDEECYADVEQRITVALEHLDQAELLADKDESRNTIQQLCKSICDWGVIARYVHDAFATYQDIVQLKVMAYFSTLCEIGNVLVGLDALMTTGIVLNVQAAHVAAAGYLNNGQDQLLDKAHEAIDSAKAKIDVAEPSDEPLHSALKSFTTALELYEDGLNKAVVYRKVAYRLFHEDMAPLGARTQADLEDFRQRNIDYAVWIAANGPKVTLERDTNDVAPSVEIPPVTLGNDGNNQMARHINMLANLQFSDVDYDRQTESIDDMSQFYASINKHFDWLQQIKPGISDSGAILAAENRLQEIAKRIRQTFYSSYEDKSYIGDLRAYKRPDVIVMLGAIRSVSEQRLERTLALARQFPEASIVMSGRGRGVYLDAAAMKDYLIANGVTADRLISEEDSLDTIGNAVFTKLILRESAISRSNILLVTSDFHGPRAVYLFSAIFGPHYHVAAALQPFSNSSPELMVRIIHAELTQIATFANQMLTLPALPGAIASTSLHGDESAVLFQMLLNHDLYQSRWEIAHRYGFHVAATEF